jgi:hypothetical protein
MKVLFALFFALVTVMLTAVFSCAADFYGASIEYKHVPSSFSKYELYGYYYAVIKVAGKSPAEKAGFRPGDIILAINNKKVKSESELNLRDDILDVLVFSYNERKALKINRLEVEEEKIRQTPPVEKQAVKPQPASPPAVKTIRQSDTSAPLKFDDTSLDNRYGKSSTPQQTNSSKTGKSDQKEKQKAVPWKEDCEKLDHFRGQVRMYCLGKGGGDPQNVKRAFGEAMKKHQPETLKAAHDATMSCQYYTNIVKNLESKCGGANTP